MKKLHSRLESLKPWSREKRITFFVVVDSIKRQIDAAERVRYLTLLRTSAVVVKQLKKTLTMISSKSFI